MNPNHALSHNYGHLGTPIPAAAPSWRRTARAGGRKFAIALRRQEPRSPYRRKRFLPSAPGIRRLRHRPGHGTAPGLGLRPPSPAPLRRDERSQGLPLPARPPGAV